MIQEINGHTRLCGLIGNPVEHTMSPLIHNSLAEEEKRNLIYTPFPVEQELLGDAVRGAYGLNVLGLNVTVPYKEAVCEHLVEIDDLAEKIGAVNTLVRTGGGYKGYNTDMPGLYRAMCSEGIRLEGERVLILGAGGAARAVAFMCANYGAEQILIMNRTLEKAEAVAEEVRRRTGSSCLRAMRLQDHTDLPEGEQFLAIQATSVGLFPHIEEVVIGDPGFYARIHTGFDLIYKPADTRFMQLVRAAGGKACHGLKMLLYQGVIAYELWNQTRISEETAEKVYKRMKKEMGIEE